MVQMTIFDYKNFERGDKVKVRLVASPEYDPELYFYAIKYLNKKGVVKEKIKNAYKVDFNGDIGYFYDFELEEYNHG